MSKTATKEKKKLNPIFEDILFTLKARQNFIFIESVEEERVLKALHALSPHIDRGVSKKIYHWKSSQGLVEFEPEAKVEKIDSATFDPSAALDKVKQTPDKANIIYLFRDLHPYIATDPGIVRRLRDIAQGFRGTENALIVIGPRGINAPDLEKEVVSITFPLPAQEEFAKRIDFGIEDIRNDREGDVDLTEYTPELRDKIARAASGLTMGELEDILARALAETGGVKDSIVDIVNREKAKVVRKNPALEIIQVNETMNDLGGLREVKDWVGKRKYTFTEEARDFGLDYSKGVLMLGLPGGGKGLAARAFAHEWQLPLIRLDFGSVFGGIVGESESNLRSALRVIEAAAPCILWVDEIEKALAGVASSSISDGGTTSRVFSYFLTWLQEKKAPVFVYFTANNIQDRNGNSILPPELLRKGRVDEIFFIDLPTHDERKEILSIHIRKKGRDIKDFDIDELADECQGFVGAEIEQVINSAMVDAFYHKKQHGQGDLSTGFILTAIRKTVPMIRTMTKDIEALRTFVKMGRAVPASGQLNSEVDNLMKSLG